jgi:hypothetical protein
VQGDNVVILHVRHRLSPIASFPSATVASRRSLDIDQTAWALIQQYGDDAALAAYVHMEHEEGKAALWRSVLVRLIELDFMPGEIAVATRHHRRPTSLH